MILNILNRCKTYISDLADSIVAKELDKEKYCPTYHSQTHKNTWHQYLIKELNDIVKNRRVVEYHLVVINYKDSYEGGESSYNELGKLVKIGGLNISDIQSFLNRIIKNDQDLSLVSWAGFIKFNNSHWVESVIEEDMYGDPIYVWKEFKVPSIKTFEI